VPFSLNSNRARLRSCPLPQCFQTDVECVLAHVLIPMRRHVEHQQCRKPRKNPQPPVLQNYLEKHWRDNPTGLLFPNRWGTHPLWRDNVVKYGLKPVLERLGIPVKFAGLHAFRHGLATQLADRSTPIPVLQKQMRHADVRTTLRVYAHVIPQTQRDAMEDVSIGTVPVMEQEQATTV
jgi:integrase